MKVLSCIWFLIIILMTILLQVNCEQLKLSINNGSEIQNDNTNHLRQKLAHHLLSWTTYNTIVAGSKPVIVQIGFSLNAIKELDFRFRIFITIAQLNYKWRDKRLKWNITQYGGIKTIAVFAHRIWKPAILLKNGVDEQYDPTFQIPATVSYDGTIHYNPPGLFKTYCSITAEYFPFDYQTCSFKFGLVHDEGVNFTKIRLSPNAADLVLKDYERNQACQWDIVNITADKSVKMHTGVDMPLGELSFHLTLRRKPLYYIWSLIIPLLIMSYIFPLILIIPINGKERLICGFLLLGILPEALRWYFADYNTPTSYNVISMLGKYTIMINTLGIIVIIESILQMLLFSRRRSDEKISIEEDHENFHKDVNVTSSNKVHDTNGQQQMQSDSSDAENNNCCSRCRYIIPRTFDVILVIIFYTIITSWIISTYINLPWVYDYRQHL